MRRISIADRRSVRTTFKLSKNTIYGLKDLAEEYRITYKELFETICSNNLEPLFDDFQEDLTKSLGQIDQKDLSIKKTYVISRYSHNLMNRFKSKYKISRNLLLEYLFTSYEADRSLKKESLIKRHKEALKRINKIISLIEKELKGLDEVLDYSDDHDAPIFDILDEVILELIMYLKRQIENELEHGTRIDIPYSIIKSMSDLYERR